MDEAPPPVAAPRVEYLRVRNFRALKDLELRDLTPLTALIGPNGSGKSTVFDVFAFLHEAFTTSLRTAVESRFGMRELRTRGETGPIEIEIQYRVPDVTGVCSYTVVITEKDDQLIVVHERLILMPPEAIGAVVTALNLSRGFGPVESDDGKPSSLNLDTADALGAAFIGRFSGYPLVTALLRFVSDWYLSDLDASNVRRIPEAGPQRRLSRTGDNVANVLEWLAERHPERLEAIEARLRARVPRLESLGPIPTGDGRSMLQLKDAPFERPIPARYASEGTLKLLAYLTVLYGPESPGLMGFEEPEGNLPPQLLYPLAEEFRIAAARSQVFVNTHSPAILDALRPEEVRMLYRDEAGFTQAVRVADIRGVREMMDEGASLGSLWEQGFFRVGDPTKDAGMPGPGVGA